MKFNLGVLVFALFISSAAYAGPLSCNALISKIYALVSSAYDERFDLKPEKLVEYEADQKLFLEISRVNNEKMGYLFGNAKLKSGAHLGVGGDINLSLAVLAKHKEIFIYDMDSRVIGFHEVIQAGVKHSESPAEFIQLVERWQKNELSPSEREALTAELGDRFSVLSKLIVNSKLSQHFKEVQNLKDGAGQSYSYLGSQMNYDLLKSIYNNNKAHFYLGSHFDSGMLKKITEDIKRTGLKLTSIYFSNALEPRWLVDQKDPNAGMIMMMVSLGGIDRISVEPEIKHIQNELAKAKADGTFESAMYGLNERINYVAMKAQMVAMGRKNWNRLAKGLAAMPVDPSAKVLMTALEPFEILNIDKKQYEILGEEQSEIEGEGYLHWTYTATEAGQFIPKMPNAPMNFAEKVMSDLKKLLKQ